MKVRNGLEAIGTSLLLLPWYLDFLSPSNIRMFHHGLPVTNLIGGLLVDLLVVAILAFAFLVTIRHLPAPAQRAAQTLFAAFMLWRMADVGIRAWITTSSSSNLRYEFLWDSVRKPAILLVLLASCLLAYFRPLIAQPAVAAVRLVIAAFAFSAVWIVPQLVRIALIHPLDENSASLSLPAAASGGPNKRIIWILFDELSYDQTFDHPAFGVELPNFDRLRSESVSFNHLSPIGLSTDRIIPSLFLGRRINQIQSTVDSNLSYKDESRNLWVPYDPNATLFALAQKNGWTAGIAGWYNPYCRMLASVLNACSWEPEDINPLPIEQRGASEDKTVLANAATLWSAFPVKAGQQTAMASSGHILGYRNVMARSGALIQNDPVRFIFLHFPLPHPPGMYDRRHRVLRPGGTYLDNLVLADETLGKLEQEIDATPSAGQTTLIVSSDHSWRISMWAHSSWSAEEERASGGHFDDRPVLLIHFPGQTSNTEVTSATSELLEHDIIAGMLEGKIGNPEDLMAFLAQHPH
jgi:hypothetical protein